MSEVQSSPKLTAYLYYHQNATKFTNKEGLDIVRQDNQFVVTPYTVHQLIKFTLKQAWKPFKAGKDIFLGHPDEKIDLRLEKNKVDKIKQPNQK